SSLRHSPEVLRSTSHHHSKTISCCDRYLGAVCAALENPAMKHEFLDSGIPFEQGAVPLKCMTGRVVRRYCPAVKRLFHFDDPLMNPNGWFETEMLLDLGKGQIVGALVRIVRYLMYRDVGDDIKNELSQMLDLVIHVIAADIEGLAGDYRCVFLHTMHQG